MRSLYSGHRHPKVGACPHGPTQTFLVTFISLGIMVKHINHGETHLLGMKCVLPFFNKAK